VYNGGSVTVTNSTVSDNRSGGCEGPCSGGGIANSGGTLTLTNSTVSGNSITGCSPCSGGGISNGGMATLTNSTVSGNSTTGGNGGGILNDGTATLTNNTVSGNSATGGNGGGIANESAATLTNSTLSANSAAAGDGGDIWNNAAVTLTNSIVANSLSGGNCAGGIITDGGYNLDSGTTCGLNGTTDKTNVNPLLGPLQANGGPTATMALSTSPTASPAIDAIPAGTNGCGTTVTTDQRGVARPQGSGCDIGAYEYGDVAMQALAASPIPVKHDKSLTLTATVVNAGAVDATGVAVTDTLPMGETFKSANSSQGSCSVVSSTVTCDLGQVGAATNPTVTIVVKVTAKKHQTLSNTATVSATTGDTIPSNDSKSVSVTVS
jgi:uncharacterized repeat protein (TIGR01451 family)